MLHPMFVNTAVRGFPKRPRPCAWGRARAARFASPCSPRDSSRCPFTHASTPPFTQANLSPNFIWRLLRHSLPIADRRTLHLACPTVTGPTPCSHIAILCTMYIEAARHAAWPDRIAYKHHSFAEFRHDSFICSGNRRIVAGMAS